MRETFQIGRRLLQPGSPPYVVAEIGVNHDGDLRRAYELIDAVARSGADAAKFQTFHTEEFMADKDLEYEYHFAGHRVRESMYDMFKRLELPADWHRKLQQHAGEKGVEFLSSAADTQAADFLAELKIPAIKIASEDIINLPLLEHVAQLKVPIILSTGMADESEIDRAVSIIREHKNSNLLLLHCVSLYPTPDEEANLRRMVRLRERYNTMVGYSDHTFDCIAAVAAVALGAVLIEKHFTLDRSLPGPDHAFSADPEELSDLVRAVRRVALQRGYDDLAPSAEERNARKQFRRSIVAASDIPEGTIIERAMLCLKRPGTGIAPHKMPELIGRRTRKAFAKDQQINEDDLE